MAKTSDWLVNTTQSANNDDSNRMNSFFFEVADDKDVKKAK